MNKKALITLGAVLVVLIVLSLWVLPEQEREKSSRLSVVASFYPLYFFATEIGKEYVEVRNIVPAGAEPHDYEPTPQDLIVIEKSDVLVLNGEGFEAWREDIARSLEGKETTVILAGEELATREFTEEEHALEEEHEEAEAEGHEEEEEHIMDPHIWLSPALAKTMAERITEGFISADPANETAYRKNNAALALKLDKLDGEFRQGLASCTRKDVITSHAAFGYIARDFGLRQIPLRGLSPDEEPTIQELAAVAEFAKRNGVKYIFFETLVSPKLSETVASEIGAETLVLNPLEGLTPSDIESGKDYFSVMRGNLQNLRRALECN